VRGKGGLVREVMIPHNLSEQLETLRFDLPKRVKDRKIRYLTQYNINAGCYLSNQFTIASKRLFNWSGGLHGLRHSYAQDRMHELEGLQVDVEDAKIIVSQELGHFGPEIVDVYLR